MLPALLAVALLSAPPDPRPVTSLEATATPAETTPSDRHDLPLGTLPDDRLTVEVTVEGRGPFRFLVDTGANRSVVSHQLASRLSLPPGRSVRMHSVTGPSQQRTARISGMRVADRALPEISAPLLDAQHVRADGIIGTDLLRSSLVHFDFKANLLSIGAPGSKRAPADEDQETIVVTGKRRDGRLIVTEAEADGQRLTVVLDTGSEVTIGNEALRRALARRGNLVDDRRIELASVTGERLPASLMVLDKLELGGLALQGLGIAFADAHTFAVMGLERRPALLLGMNALRAFDSVTIDLGARKLRFVLASRAGRGEGGRHAP
jgi:predicted aspartyl protease